LNAVPVEDDGLKPGKECQMSLFGREALQRCCTNKLEAFKKFINKTCLETPADFNSSTWCDGVPDGEAVQIGGRAADSKDYWNHHSPNACAAASWKQMDYAMIKGTDQLLRTAAPTSFAPSPAPVTVCVDHNEGIKEVHGFGNCAAVAEFCSDTNWPTVQKHCPKTCGKCEEIDAALEQDISAAKKTFGDTVLRKHGVPHADMELDDALAGISKSGAWTLTSKNQQRTHKQTQDQGTNNAESEGTERERKTSGKSSTMQDLNELGSVLVEMEHAQKSMVRSEWADEDGGEADGWACL